MVAQSRIWCVAIGMTAAAYALAQAPVPTLPPAPIAAPAAVYGEAPAPLLPARPPVTLGSPLPPPGQVYAAPPPPATYAPVPLSPYAQQPLFVPADPGRDGWGPIGMPSDFPTVFFGLDLYFLQPSISGTLRGNMPLAGGGSHTYSTPRSSLDFTVSPRVEIGWRLPDSQGEFAFSYRFIGADGRATNVSDFGAIDTRSRLSMNILDFDYATARYAFLPRWNAQWRIGARVETVFYDHQGSNAVFGEKASNYFVAAGPHAAVQVDREINFIPGLAAFAKVDAAVVIGQLRQRFGESFPAFGNSNFDQNRTQSSPSVALQTGLIYIPPGMNYLTFLAGFQYERFWEVGKIAGSTGDIQDYGGFVGAKFDF